MMRRQRGLSLVWVAVIAGGLAFLAMVAMMSMRNERNYFAEGLSKATQAVPKALPVAAGAPPAGGPLRKCVIDGQTVISNTDCKDSNKTSRDLKIHDTRGIEAPKVPAKPKEEHGSDPALDKIIEKQTQS